jgi:hypothetical protein
MYSHLERSELIDFRYFPFVPYKKTLPANDIITANKREP